MKLLLVLALSVIVSTHQQDPNPIQGQQYMETLIVYNG